MNGASFVVDGDPVQQGSKIIRYGKADAKGHRRAFIADDNSHALKAWRKSVAAAAREAWTDRPMISGAVELRVGFRLTQPKTVRREYPSVRPDVDKLLRALMDGIGDAGCVWEDDARVVRVSVDKAYADRPGVFVTVAALEQRSEGNG